MIKELMHDPIFLAGKSEVATKEDLHFKKNINNCGEGTANFVSEAIEIYCEKK